MAKVAGYCALCRAKEIELYGTVLSSSGLKHQKACKEAGCLHPASYASNDPVMLKGLAEAQARWNKFKALSPAARRAWLKSRAKK